MVMLSGSLILCEQLHVGNGAGSGAHVEQENSSLFLIFLPSVVGEVKDIDWFDPSGEKILPNRQDISVSRTEETSTLVIYKANMDNAGIYTCVAKDGEKEAQATVKVTIYRKCLQR